MKSHIHRLQSLGHGLFGSYYSAYTGHHPMKRGIMGKDRKGRGHMRAASKMTPAWVGFTAQPQRCSLIITLVIKSECPAPPCPITSQMWRMRSRTRGTKTNPIRGPKGVTVPGPGPASPRRLALPPDMCPGVDGCPIAMQ